MVAQRRGAAIEISGLRKDYVSGQGTVTALDNVDLKIAPGEFLCIVGPSGCGKSTLDRKSTRLNPSHMSESRMPSSA